MKIRQILAGLVLIFVLNAIVTGCASSGETTLFGTGVGAALGGGVGMLADPGPKGRNRIRNVFIGATAGSLVGAGTGYLLHNTMEKSEKNGYEKGKKDVQKGSLQSAGVTNEPVLIPARVESVFIDDQVRGNTFVPAHIEFRIAEPAKWQR